LILKDFPHRAGIMTSPLFILATPRAYTSVICGMLGQHPEAYGFPELNLFILDRLKDFWGIDTGKFGFTNNRRHGVLRTVAELYGGEQSTEAVDMARRWCASRENRTGGEVFRELVEKLEPKIAIDKSPIYTLDMKYLKRIADTFPDARYLHLVRHPINQGNSVMNLYDGAFAVIAHSFDFTEDKAVIDPQLAWHDINANILDFLAGIPSHQQMRIRGEDVMKEPEQHLGEICRWLGISSDSEAMDAMMHPENSPYACIGPINAMYGNDPNFLRRASFTPHQPRLPDLDSSLAWRDDGQGLYPEVQELAREFGY
jgi:hypothetical protein